MKKSTLLFIAGNLFVMFVPIIFMFGLRNKINRGDILDLKAMQSASVQKEILPKIDSIEITGQYGVVSVSIDRDTTNFISIDTADYKYVTYRIKDHTLYIDYNFKKDSLENSSIAVALTKTKTSGGALSTGISRGVKLRLNADVFQLKLKEANVSYHISPDFTISHDIEVIAQNGDFSLDNEDDNDYNYEDDETKASIDSIPFKVKAILNDASFDMQMDYVKHIDIESRNSLVKIYNVDFKDFDLKVDENTSMSIDIAKLRKMKIQYLE